jgi:hypothetical protein
VINPKWIYIYVFDVLFSSNAFVAFNVLRMVIAKRIFEAFIDIEECFVDWRVGLFNNIATSVAITMLFYDALTVFGIGCIVECFRVTDWAFYNVHSY